MLATTLVAALILSACGGGSGNAGTPGAPVAPNITLAATTNQTLAGGKSLTLTASASDNSAVTWALASGSVGSLSAASGATVSYMPPASVTANTSVTVNASVGGVSKSLALTVFPEPGAPGLSILSGRLNSEMLDSITDGPAALARFRDSRAVAADPAGNLYVAGACRYPSRQQGLTLRKISAAGTVSTLASCSDNSWFGASNMGSYLLKFYLPYGIAADRAGNIYTATYFYSITAGSASNEGRAVYKISPQGTLTLLAGAGGSHTADLKDGNGADARFLTPNVIGLDSDENLYVNDKDDSVLRKISPAAEVTTVSTLPASVNADLNGNTYRVDATSGTIIRTTPGGTDSTIADIHTLPGVVSTMTPLPYSLVRTGPATYVLLVSTGYLFSNEAIVQLVVAH
jgi:hypothetical protein